MKIKTKLTISRPVYGCGKEKISIQVRDVDAHIRFLDIEIDLDKFTKCITGLSEIECTATLRGIENVGKKRETMAIEVEIPKNIYTNRKETAYVLAKKCTPKGWQCSKFFGSQSSFFEREGKSYAKTTATRWVNK